MTKLHFVQSIIQEQIRRMVKGQSAHLYPSDLCKLEIILPPKDIQEKVAHLNIGSQAEYNARMKEATVHLENTRQEIENIILNGDIPRK